MTGTASSNLQSLHENIAIRMASAGQRYTSGRRRLVESLFRSSRPLDIAAVVKATSGVPQSSAYRSLALFSTLGIVHRIAGADDVGYYELSEEFVGQHHHHALCQSCGRVVDIESSARLERALNDAARLAGENSGFVIDAHRIDFVGTCDRCA